MRRLLTLVALLAATSASAQIERTTIERTTISVAAPSEEGDTCSTLSRTFNGTDQYFTNADGSHVALEVGASKDFAAAFWVYLADTAGTYGIYFNGGTGALNKGVRVYFFNGTLYGDVYDAVRYQDVADSATTVGWHYVTVHADRSGTLRIGLDGVEVDASPADISASELSDLSNSVDLRVGMANLTGGFLAGRLDLVGVWVDAAPTFAQLNADQTVTACAGWTVAPTACWEMDGAAGANEADRIGTVDLTQVNSPGSADGPGEGCE